MLNTEVTALAESDDGLAVHLQGSDGQSFSNTYAKILLAVGRVPNSEDLGLERTAVGRDERGYVQVDDQLRTAEPSIFAIGDPRRSGPRPHGRPPREPRPPRSSPGTISRSSRPTPFPTSSIPTRKSLGVASLRKKQKSRSARSRSRALSLVGFWPRRNPRHQRRPHQAAHRPSDRPDPRRGHCRQRCWRADRRGRLGRGNGCPRSRCPACDPPPSHAVRNPHGSGRKPLLPERASLRAQTPLKHCVQGPEMRFRPHR